LQGTCLYHANVCVGLLYINILAEPFEQFGFGRIAAKGDTEIGSLFLQGLHDRGCLADMAKAVRRQGDNKVKAHDFGMLILDVNMVCQSCSAGCFRSMCL